MDGYHEDLCLFDVHMHLGDKYETRDRCFGEPSCFLLDLGPNNEWLIEIHWSICAEGSLAWLAFRASVA